MNIQMKRFGVDLQSFDKTGTEGVIRVRIYHNYEEEKPESFVYSLVDLTDFVIVHRGIKYKCLDSRPTNSEQLKTYLIPISESDPEINLDAVTI